MLYFQELGSLLNVSRPSVTVGLMILQYNFNFDFLETNLL